MQTMTRARLALAAALTTLAMAATDAQSPARDVTILYTNDFHSAFDPTPAYWMPGSPRLGGAAQLTSLVNRVRARETPVFLFDTGDMFTGMLSNLTRGEALMEMMLSMGYDAMAIGNHEFDYGSANFTAQINRVPFPVLGANIFYRDTGRPYARPYTILERGGLRVGVIGVIGQDARSVALPSGITDLDFRDPVPIVRAHVAALRPEVDLIVVLAHQGKTGPMQSDAEARPEVQRDFDEDVRLAGAVEGIDVLVGGHAHRGIETPFVHPRTGTLIVQTYGYGTRLGYLKLQLRGGRVAAHTGELIEVRSDDLPADPLVASKIAAYRTRFEAQIGRPIGRTAVRLVRDYRAESSLGSFVADVMREETGADVGFQNAGGLRADIPAGVVTNGHILDALPFPNTIVVCEMTGAQIRAVLEQGLTLERGMIQVSGLEARYDLRRPPGTRIVSLTIGGAPVDGTRTYTAATNSFLAQAGDLYAAFAGTRQKDTGLTLSEVMIRRVERDGVITPPQPGRLAPAHQH